MRRRRRLMAVAVVSATALVVGSAPAAAEIDPAQPVWWALGDSYSSGEGVRQVDPGPNGLRPNGKTCQRASGTDTSRGDSRAIPGRAGALAAYDILAGEPARRSNLQLVACTGAITDDWSWQLEQARTYSGEDTPDVISLSFGGNNIGFFVTLLGCLSAVPRDVLQIIIGDVVPSGLIDGGCVDTKDSIDNRIGALAGTSTAPLAAGGVTLPSLYGALAGHVSPGGHVFVVGYPQLIADPDEWGMANLFLDSCWGINAEDARLWRASISALNAAIRGAVEDANAVGRNGVQYHWVDTTASFETGTGSHALCGQGNSWLHGISFSIDGEIRPERSFHPNQTGHDTIGQAIADTINTEIGGVEGLLAPTAARDNDCGSLDAYLDDADWPGQVKIICTNEWALGIFNAASNIGASIYRTKAGGWDELDSFNLGERSLSSTLTGFGASAADVSALCSSLIRGMSGLWADTSFIGC